MESVWTVDRIRLYQLSRDNPEWSQRKLAEHLGYSLSCVIPRDARDDWFAGEQVVVRAAKGRDGNLTAMVERLAHNP